MRSETEVDLTDHFRPPRLGTAPRPVGWSVTRQPIAQTGAALRLTSGRPEVLAVSRGPAGPDLQKDAWRLTTTATLGASRVTPVADRPGPHWLMWQRAELVDARRETRTARTPVSIGPKLGRLRVRSTSGRARSRSLRPTSSRGAGRTATHRSALGLPSGCGVWHRPTSMSANGNS